MHVGLGQLFIDTIISGLSFPKLRHQTTLFVVVFWALRMGVLYGHFSWVFTFYRLVSPLSVIYMIYSVVIII